MMNLKEKIDMKKVKIAVLLIGIGVLGRILLHDAFNSITNPLQTGGFPVPLDVFFVIAAVSLFAGLFLGKFYAFIVPVCIIALTDIFYVAINPSYAMYWTTSLFLFTWSGYLVIALLGSLLKKKPQKTWSFVPLLAGAGVLGIIAYDLWTNFGFWLGYSKLGFYPQTWEGLATVFIGGLPSMVWHLLSTTLVIVGISIPLLYLKKQELLCKDRVLKPVEKYAVVSATVVLLCACIVTALV